jgi:hypothetical protein
VWLAQIELRGEEKKVAMIYYSYFEQKIKFKILALVVKTQKRKKQH